MADLTGMQPQQQQSVWSTHTCFVVIWKHFCLIVLTGTRIRTDSVMRPRSSSRGRNTNASFTVTRRPSGLLMIHAMLTPAVKYGCVSWPWPVYKPTSKALASKFSQKMSAYTRVCTVCRDWYPALLILWRRMMSTSEIIMPLFLDDDVPRSLSQYACVCG